MPKVYANLHKLHICTAKRPYDNEIIQNVCACWGDVLNLIVQGCVHVNLGKTDLKWTMHVMPKGISRCFPWLSIEGRGRFRIRNGFSNACNLLLRNRKAFPKGDSKFCLCIDKQHLLPSGRTVFKPPKVTMKGKPVRHTNKCPLDCPEAKHLFKIKIPMQVVFSSTRFSVSNYKKLRSLPS